MRKTFLTLALCAWLSACQSTPKQSRNNNEVAQTRVALAAEFIYNNKLDDAKRQLEIALNADANYAPAYEMMGILLHREGSAPNMSAAEGYFKKALALDPDFVRARNNYGVYLRDLGRFDEALAQFNIAGATLGYEGRAQSLENLGQTYLRMNQTELAMDAFLRALDADITVVVARLELIDIYLKRGQFLNAKAYYDDIVRLAGTQNLPANVLLHGIKIAHAQGNEAQRQLLAQRLLANYPLSAEAQSLKKWLTEGVFE